MIKSDPVSNTAAANTAVTANATAWPGVKRTIKHVSWSLSASPATAVALTFSSGNTVYQVDITTGGPGFIGFPEQGWPGEEGTAITVTLAAAGASIVGKLNILADRS